MKKMEEKAKPILTKANGAQKTIAVCAIISTLALIVDLLVKIGVVALVAEKAKPYVSALSAMAGTLMGGHTEQKEN